MTNYDVARLLRDYKQTKKEARDLRAEMLRLAADELGIDRKTATHTNLEAFLEGYLAGQEKVQSCQTMTNYQISSVLRHSQHTKKKTQNLRAELLRVAVEEAGMEQSDALQANLEVFIDGYLAGQGMVQELRKCGT